MRNTGLLILLSTILVFGFSQSIKNIGGYKTYTDLGSSDFQKVLSYIFTVHPQISNYKAVTVLRQLVNGWNYKVTLAYQDCKVDAIVYAPFQGSPSLSDYNAPPCKESQPVIVGPIISTPGLIAGGYIIQVNPSGSQFDKALSQAISQNSQYTKGDLVLVQTQVVSGTNYRFSFRNFDGTLSQIIIYVPLFSDTPVLANSGANSASIVSFPLAGAFQEITSTPLAYQDVLAIIYKNYPEVKSYRVEYVAQQIVAGKKYKISLENNTLKKIAYASFSVYVDLTGRSTISLVSWINFTNYTVADVISATSNTFKLHSQIKDFNLLRIENIWQNGDGLKLTFVNENKKYSVFIYKHNGQLLNKIY